MTTRQLTQEEIDKAPGWATHYQIYEDDKDVCFESEDFYQLILNGVVKCNVIGLEDESIPIPRKETTTTTKVIELKKGERLHLNNRIFDLPDFMSDDCKTYDEELDVNCMAKNVTVTITIEVK